MSFLTIYQNISLKLIQKIKQKIFKKLKVKTVDIENYEFIKRVYKKKLIWSRKSDRIKNDLDYDINKLNKLKKRKKVYRLKKKIFIKRMKKQVKLFAKQNKFEKFNTIEIKNNRRI